MNPLRPLALLVVVVPLAVGCSPSEEDDAAPAQPVAEAGRAPVAAPPPAGTNALPPGHPPTAGNAAPAVPPPGREGVVTAVHQAGGYTYLEVERNGRRAWLASSPVAVAVGDRVAWADAALMRDFPSRALGRTFDELLFVTGVRRVATEGGEAANRATVVGLTRAGGYHYLELESNGRRRWLAAQQAPVEVGDTVSWRGGTVMHDFSSKTLDRTFDEIIFVGSVTEAD